MRENEFEKRVQKKMEDLNLRPSDEVWVEVERRIRKEKKRRFIFWWPLLFLLLGGGVAAGIWINGKKEKTGSIAVDNNAENKFQSPAEKTTIPLPAETLKIKDTNGIAGNRKIIITDKENKTDKKLSSDNTTNTLLPANQSVQNKTAGIKKQKTNTLKTNSRSIADDKIVNADKQSKDQSKEPVDAVIAATVPVKQTADPVQDSANTKISDVAVQTRQEVRQDISQKDQPQQREPVQERADSNNMNGKTKPEHKKSKKGDWGITFSAGKSGIVNGLHFFDSPLYADAMVLQTGSTGSPANISSSIVRSAASFGGGLFVKRPLSKKLELNAGFGYMYLSTKINVGNRVDSTRSINNSNSQGLSVNNFYRVSGSSANSSSAAYTNQYHFISLSGDLSWRIINGKKVKVFWENGLSYNRLIASTMLQYDQNLPGYYKDNSLLKKNHLFISTGLSVPVSKRLVINPFAAYGLTPVLKSSDSLRTHFTNYGIRIRYLLNKK